MSIFVSNTQFKGYLIHTIMKHSNENKIQAHGEGLDKMLSKRLYCFVFMPQFVAKTGENRCYCSFCGVKDPQFSMTVHDLPI